MDELKWCDKCGNFMIACTDGSYYCMNCNDIYKEQFKIYTTNNTNTNNAFMPNPHMDDRIYLCEEGLMNCFTCIGKESCNHYRVKCTGLEGTDE